MTHNQIPAAFAARQLAAAPTRPALPAGRNPAICEEFLAQVRFEDVQSTLATTPSDILRRIGQIGRAPGISFTAETEPRRRPPVQSADFMALYPDATSRQQFLQRAQAAHLAIGTTALEANDE